jgi:hypothetical protein
MRIRPLRGSDDEEHVEAARLIRGAGYGSDAPSSLVGHLASHDAAGCWVASDEDSRMSGVVMSLRRDLLWCLSALAVNPPAEGVGSRLLEAALLYSRGCLRGLAVLPDHPSTARLVRMAGFVLHPTMRLSGTVDRSALPLVDGVRDATDGDRAFVDSIDRQVRGAARGPDHDALSAHGQLLVCDLTTGSGYAYHRDGSVIALGATTREVARRLLWSVMARSARGSRVEVARLSAEQDWAVDVGLAAGLGVHAGGFLALRHMRPPAPYIPSAWLG